MRHPCGGPFEFGLFNDGSFRDGLFHDETSLMGQFVCTSSICTSWSTTERKLIENFSDKLQVEKLYTTRLTPSHPPFR